MNTLSYPTRASSSMSDDTRTVPDRHLALEGKPIEEVLSFRHYLLLLRQHAWKISGAVAATIVLTVLYCSSVQPVYEATTRITIDQRTPSMAIGQQAAPAGPAEVDSLMITEIQIIQSDAVLRPVAEQFHLLQTAAPLPALRVAEKLHLVRVAQKLHLLNDNDIQLTIDAAASKSLSEAPVVLGSLSVARLPNSLIIDIRYRSHDPRLAARVANAIADSYLARGAEMRTKSSMGLSSFMERQIVELKKNMDDSSFAVAGYERALGVINSDEKTSMMAARLLQLNAQYTEAENDRIRKEAEYRQVQAGVAPGTNVALYGAAIELSPQAVMLSRQEERLHEAEEKLAVAKTVYGPNYAEYKRAANDVAELTRQCVQTRVDISKRIEVSYREAVNREGLLHLSLEHAKDESDHLNAHSGQYQELKREAEANKTLYDELFRKIKEATINAGFESSSIRIADEARPPAFPIFPKKSLFAALAFLLSLMASVLAVFVADMFDKTLGDPEKAGRLTGMQVIGVLPSVKNFSQVHDFSVADEYMIDELGRAERPKNWVSNKELYAESIATLLSTVLLSRASARPRSLLITSAGPEEGKSSCAAHLALEHASQGKKTLLIDADLRSPFQQRYFNLKAETTRGWIIPGDGPLTAMRHKIEGSPTLDVVFFSPATNRAVLKHVGLKVTVLLQRALIEGYDLVIVDAPPMLGLAEPIQIACATDDVLVIGDASKTSQKAIVDMVQTFERFNVKMLGLVLNRFRPELSETYKHYRSYSSSIRRLPAPATT